MTKTLSYLAMMLILVSCAQIRPLTGGEKDETAPKELVSTPINGATNFIEKTIVVEFDEFIKLTNVTSQLIVSPLMETPPVIMVKGKKLVIKLQSDLSENTTYSLNFGNAITDITESNIFPNYKYVFSTGPIIDSLSYSGTVLNAFDLSKKESIYVLLYDQFEDSIPLKELPRYVALTDEEGKYSITNIAQGEYKFFAIKDINNNYLFDLPNEEIAFMDETIFIDSISSENTIHLFEDESELQFLKKAENKIFGKIDIR
ncbi:MAG: Ig-like domain-containing protein [Vicingaceae bacterium]